VGRTVELLVLDSAGKEAGGRKDAATARLSGRSPDNRLVHFAVPDGAERPRPGDLVTVDVTRGAPHYLIADSGIDGGTYAVRRTRAGDAWDAVQSGEHDHSHGGCGDSCGTGAPTGGPVGLGMPSLRRVDA
ncbi:MAG: tRNA (N6-isopentenyl adenosine(37)-C2)-methylthiotransferase MiaB, partial [Demequina sp.]